MASRFTVDGAGVKFILGTDTAELEGEIQAEAARAKAAEKSLRDAINQHGNEGHADAIAELDVQGLDIVTNTFGGTAETQRIGLPSLVHDIDFDASTGHLTKTIREPSGAETPTTYSIGSSGGGATVTQATFGVPSATAYNNLYRYVAMTGSGVSGKLSFGTINVASSHTVPVRCLNVEVECTLFMAVQARGGSSGLGLTLQLYRSGSEVTRIPIQRGATGGTYNFGPLPVEAGDQILVRVSPDSQSSISSPSAGIGGVRGMTVTLIEATGGFSGSTTPRRTNAQVQDLAGNIAATAPILSYDSTAKTLTVPNGSITEEMLAEDAQPTNPDEVVYLSGDVNLNSTVAEGLYAQTTNTRLTNSPFAGPLVMFVQPIGEAAPFSLTQQAWSLSSPGLYAERALVNQGSKPSSITLTWRIHHARAQLPSTLAAATSVTVEGLEDDSARWTAAPIEATFDTVGPRGSAYVQASPNSHGFVQIATSNVPFMSRHSGYSEAAAYGPLFVELTDGAFQGGSADDYISGATLHYRRAGLTTNFTTVGLSTRVDGQGFIIFASSGNVTIPTGQDLEVYFSYVSASQSREVVPIPGAYQPEGVRLSKFAVPMRDGQPDYLGQDAVDARIARLRPNEFTTQLRDKLTALRQGLLAAQVRAFALAATSDADAQAALQALLPAGNSHQARPVTALPDIREQQLGAEVYLISDATASAYGVVSLADSGVTGLRGWFRGSYGDIDNLPENLNQDALLVYDQSYQGTGASELRGSVFYVRGSNNEFPDAVEINGTRTNLNATSPTGFPRYRQVGALVATGFPNGNYVYRVFDGTVNRFGTEAFESGDYRADTEALRWRELSGQYTIPEIESRFHEFCLATFTGTIPRRFLPSVSQADATPRGSFTSTGNRLTAISLANNNNLGDTGSIAVFKFETATDYFAQQFEVVDRKWAHFSIAYGSGSVFGVRLRSRVTENDIALERTSSGAFLNGTYSVALV